jgi:hypothetical protein
MRLTCQSPTPSAPTRWSVSRFGRTRSARPARCPRRNVFSAFVLLCRRLDLYGRELLAVDGTRIKAVNNKDRNFTRTSLQEFIRAADERLDDYLIRGVLKVGFICRCHYDAGANLPGLGRKFSVSISARD